MPSESQREDLYKIFANTDLGIKEKIDNALDLGVECLGLSVGFFTRFSEENQEIVCVIGGSDIIQPGETHPSGLIHSKRTAETDSVFSIDDTEPPTYCLDVIKTLGLGAYIGSNVLVNGEIYGSVCFADETQQHRTFTEAEEVFLELFAELLGNQIEKRVHNHELQERNERLTQQNERLRAITENSFDILYQVDREGTFTYISPAAERVLGYSTETLTGQPVKDFLTEDVVEKAATAHTDVLAGETVERLELKLRTKQGSVSTIETNSTPIRKDGSIIRVQGVGRDITARKEREQDLRITTKAIDEANIGVVISDPAKPDNPLIYINENFEELAGYKEEEVLGRNCRFLQGDATDPETVERLRTAIDNQEPITIELVNYRKDGTPFWNQLHVDPIFDDQGEILRYIGFQQDVTRRQRTKQLISLLNRVLRHNLRNDMTVLMGAGEAVRNQTVNDFQVIGERIERKSENLVMLSERAQELETLATQERNPQRLDPVTLVEEIVGQTRETYPATQFVVHNKTERDMCVGSEIRRALTELIENGIIHNPNAEPHLEITIRDDEQQVVIAVSDDGSGISETESEVISEGNETPLRHGVGMGLWLINWIVTRYGGSFQIRADDGSDGTTGLIHLPALDAGTPIQAVDSGPTVLFR